ncbi:MAG: penicillin-binding transpeptidase domain-containing protein [Myxococcota bacterium]
MQLRSLTWLAVLPSLTFSQPAPADDAPASLSGASLEVPNRVSSPPIATVESLPREADLLLRATEREDGRLVVHEGEEELELTIDARLQEALVAILRRYQTPYAAVVALEPRTGRVLAMAEHSQAQPSLRGLCTKAVYPAASIFKIVTAAALLEAGVSPSAEECFHGGKRRLSEKLLVDSARDRRCHPMSTAMAMSTNVVFAKLTHKHLSAAKLFAKAQAFHFNQPFDFPVPTEVSLASVPEDGFGLSNAGAGFGDVYLSPLHGAALAAVAANGGRWKAPVLFERDVVPGEVGEEVVSQEHARALTQMLELTVTSGTARRVFRERGFRVEGAVGKTGSLADKRPFRDYSWFVGFAPKDEPKVSVAAVVVNDPYWRIRATWLGREAMRLSLAQPPQQPRDVTARSADSPRSSGTGAARRARAGEKR